MSTVIKSMDGGPDYRIHFDVTYAGCPAQGPSYSSGGQPAEGPEWNITGIDCQMWEILAAKFSDFVWVPVEHIYGKQRVEAVYGWAESLDLSDECAEAAEYERDDAAEARHEAARERQGE